VALISTVQAEDYSVYVAGVQVTSSNKDDLSGIAGVSVGTDGYIKYSATYNALYLKNVTINLPITNYNPGIQNKNTGLKIYFYGENNITTYYMMPAMMLTAQTELTSGSSGKAVLTSNSNAGLTCNSACNISNVSLECHGMSNGIDHHRQQGGGMGQQLKHLPCDSQRKKSEHKGLLHSYAAWQQQQLHDGEHSAAHP